MTETTGTTTDQVLVEDRGAIRILSLHRGKANALETGLAQELHERAHEAQEDDAVRAVVLTSSSPRIFCGGFDLAVLGKAVPEEFGRFVRVFETLFFDLFLFGKPLVAALTGHAAAGGAILASTADFRLAAEGPGRIGLPEVNLGVHVPRHCIEAMRVTVGERALTRWALGGDPIPFAEAKELGAIDRIVPAAALLDEAITLATHLGTGPSEVYASIKRDLRSSAAERARDVLVDGRKAFIDSWFSETGQRGIAATLARLGAR
jgi:enoyl-CoA hydratase